MKTWNSTNSDSYDRSAKARFEKRITRTETCWLFSSAAKAGGYPQISYRNRMVLAHRLALHFAGMVVPDGSDVLHSCDQPNCVNPQHLFVGSHTDNMRDKANKGRAPAKLTAHQVAKVKDALANGQSCNSLAKALGVSPHTISDIRDGITWRRITRPCP